MKYTLIFLLSLAAWPSVAQNDPEKIVSEFFVRYNTKGTDGAIDYLFSTNTWIKGNKEQVENLKHKFGSDLRPELMGKFLGYDFVVKKSAVGRLEEYTYMVRFERQPLRFQFLFYKGDDHWVIHHFNYDGKAEDELIEVKRNQQGDN